MRYGNSAASPRGIEPVSHGNFGASSISSSYSAYKGISMHQQHSGRHAQGNILRRCMQIIAVISLLALIKRDIDSSLHPQHRGVPFDFRATYCGEYVTAHHGNPYLSQPLRSCEISVDDKLQFPLPDEALPATLPLIRTDCSFSAWIAR